MPTRMREQLANLKRDLATAQRMMREVPTEEQRASVREQVDRFERHIAAFERLFGAQS